MDLEKKELLALYFYLSNNTNLSEQVDAALIKIEAEIFKNISVKEIEECRIAFNNKGKI